MFLNESNIIGVAIKTEEYVPTITPIISANINPLIDSPPIINIAISTINVVNEVLRVRLKVLFKSSIYNFIIIPRFMNPEELSNSIKYNNSII